MKKQILFLFLLPLGLFAQHLQINSPIRFLALGDSYTIGQSVSTTERWPVQLRDSLAVRGYQTDTLQIIATTGWRTDNLLNAVTGQHLQNKNFNLVSLLIGVNNQYQHKPFAQYQQEFPELLDSAIKFAGGDTDHVFIVSIPDYAFTPFGQQSGVANQISTELDQYNAFAKQTAQNYGIQYFDITPISRMGIQQPALVAGDGLHPSGLQYSRWVEKILNYVDSTLLTSARNLKKKIGLIVYPNPAENEITIRTDGEGTEEKTIQIFDRNGKSVLKQKYSGTNLDVDISGLKPGLFEVIVDTEIPRKTTRILKK